MTALLFRDDPDLLEFEATVVDRREVAGRPAVVLDRTAFYATSGGQPHDTGTLDGVPVVDVAFDGDVVLHVLAAPLAGDRVRGVVDRERRRDHLQQHHGQHLLSRACVEQLGAETVAFHLGADTCTIDLDKLVGEEGLRRAEERTNEIVRAGRPVSVRTMSREACAAAGIEVPPEAGDTVRIVDADGWDVNPCSGTHPRRTSEVGLVLVLGSERFKGGTRVRFACGVRAERIVVGWRSALGRSAAALQCALDDVPAGIERVVAERVAADKELKRLRELARAAEARDLALRARDGVLVHRADGIPPGELRSLAQEIVAAAPCLALLGGVEGGKAHLVFAQSPGLTRDVPGLLKASLEVLGGRGGGSTGLAQGGGTKVEALDEALALARAHSS